MVRLRLRSFFNILQNMTVTSFRVLFSLCFDYITEILNKSLTFEKEKQKAPKWQFVALRHHAVPAVG